MGPRCRSRVTRNNLLLLGGAICVALELFQQFISVFVLDVTYATLLSVSQIPASVQNFAISDDISKVDMDNESVRVSRTSLATRVTVLPSKQGWLHDDEDNNSISIDQSPNMLQLETPAISSSNTPELTTTTTKTTVEGSKEISSDDDSISIVNLESIITCREQNCLIQNACFDSGETKQKPLRIRLFGNQTHVDSEWNKIRKGQHAVIGFREAYVELSGMQGVNESRIPAVFPPHSTATFLIRWVTANCGHDLGDGAVAAFRLMRLFPRVPDQLDRLMIVGRKDACNRVFEPMAKSVVNVNFRNPLLPTNGILECHGRIYFGVRGVSYMVDHQGTWTNRRATLESDMKAFRDMYYRNSGILDNNKKRNIALPERDTIIIMEKRKGSHLSNLGNITEMANFLRQEFPHQIQVVTWDEFQSLKEQLKLMSRTRAIISLPGSDIMNGIFLHDGSALVLYCRPMQNRKGGIMFDDSNEMKYWFSHVSYVNASVAPCNSSIVSYNWTKDPFTSTTFVNLASLKARLVGLGILPSMSRQ